MNFFIAGVSTRPLAILHRKGRVLTPAMKKFIETLSSEGAAADARE